MLILNRREAEPYDNMPVKEIMFAINDNYIPLLIRTMKLVQYFYFYSIQNYLRLLRKNYLNLPLKGITD